MFGTFMDDKTMTVAAYCRVSTDSYDQANSLESQQKYFDEFIKRNPLWEMYEIYVDEGISGTNTKKRDAFNRMIADAREHKFDLIITKEISRFARNIVDSISYTRELRALGIGVMFLNDNIYTLDNDGEMRLALLSTIAQEESRKTSERVKWGQRRMMEQGKVFGKDMLGYDVRKGELIINEQGAETVRLIYHKFLDEGKGVHRIAKELREEGVATSTRMKDWSYTVILRVLKNEKYCGDLIQQKTYTADCLTHQKKYNKGELEFVTIRNHHQPIISRERFDAVQREFARRRPDEKTKAIYANRYAMSGKIKCGECGGSFVHRQKKYSNGKVLEKWVCVENQKNGSKQKDKNGLQVGCTTNSISDRDLRQILMMVVKDMKLEKVEIIDKMTKALKTVLQSSNELNAHAHLTKQLEKEEDKKKRLLDFLISGDITTQEYREAKEKLDKEIDEIKSQIAEHKDFDNLLAEKENIISDTQKYIENLLSGGEWNDMFYRRLIDKIVVYKDRKMDIHLSMLPEKWQGQIIKGKREIEAYEAKSIPCDASTPISVSKPFNSA